MSHSDASLASPFCLRPAFSAGVVSTATHKCRFLIARVQPTVRPNWLAATLAVAVSGLMMPDAVVRNAGLAPVTNALRFWAVAAAAAFVLASTCRGRGVLVMHGHQRLCTPCAWLVLTFAIFTIAGARTQFYDIPHAAPCDDLQLTLPTSGERRLNDDFMVVTEKGIRIPLYEWSTTASEFRRNAVASEQQYARDFPTIRLERSSDQTNCHGWVFTQGRHLLFGDGVEQILQDNEYSVAEQPHVNDVIIYRNSSGTILHSGIVRAVLDDGMVLIESKWGISARYLHLPHNQPYGINFQYYRSTHATHHVCIVPRATGFIANLASTVP